MQRFACENCGAAIIIKGDEVGVITNVCQKCFDQACQGLDEAHEKRQAQESEEGKELPNEGKT